MKLTRRSAARAFAIVTTALLLTITPVGPAAAGLLGGLIDVVGGVLGGVVGILDPPVAGSHS